MYWYKNEQLGDYDTLDQLYRRIGCYVEVKEQTVTLYNDGVDKWGKPVGIGQEYENELYGRKKDQVVKFDFVAAFDKICKRKEKPQQVKLSDLVEVKEELPF